MQAISLKQTSHAPGLIYHHFHICKTTPHLHYNLNQEHKWLAHMIMIKNLELAPRCSFDHVK